MRYRSSKAYRKQQIAGRIRLICSLALLLGGVGFVGYLFAKDRLPEIAAKIRAKADKDVSVKTDCIVHTRIKQEAIPVLNLRTLNYGSVFNDLNDVQLVAANANGVKDLLRWGASPETCPELLPIFSTALYYVDSMTHSKPYLVPEAATLLHFIGLRFQELQQERQKDSYTYLPIVTSAFRSQSDVARLRRRNRNSSENSCHCYGTTIDITYIRFLRNDGEVVNEEWLKQLLAKALYELRYEGLCYVKYERRQACFHITVRSTDYKGNLAAETICYTKLAPQSHRMVRRDEDGNVIAVRCGDANVSAEIALNQTDASVEQNIGSQETIRQEPQSTADRGPKVDARNKHADNYNGPVY